MNISIFIINMEESMSGSNTIITKFKLIKGRNLSIISKNNLSSQNQSNKKEILSMINSSFNNFNELTCKKTKPLLPKVINLPL